MSDLEVGRRFNQAVEATAVVGEIRTDVRELRSDTSEIKADMKDIKSDIKALRGQQDRWLGVIGGLAFVTPIVVTVALKVVFG